MTTAPAVLTTQQLIERSSTARLLLPSLADLFFCCSILWSFFSGLGWEMLLLDGDTGWHIRTGEWILDHRQVPKQDLFSFTRPGAPWFAWEWLSDVIYALLYRALGLKGIVLFSAVLLATWTTVFLRWLLWRRIGFFLALGATFAVSYASSIHFHARPHLLTLLLFTLAIWMVDSDRRREQPRIWLLIPLVALWTNLHGGFLALVAYLALTALGFLLEGEWRRAQRYALLTLGCLAASLANPYGWQLHRHIAGYLSSDWIRNHVQEFQAPTFRTPAHLVFELALFGGVAVAGWLIRSRRLSEALPICYWAHAALTVVRHVPLFMVTAVPSMAGWLSRHAPQSPLWRGLDEDCRRAAQRLSLAPLLFVGGLLAAPGISWPTDFARVKFPQQTVRRYGELLASSRVFTSDQWADYLIFHHFPRQRVFVDGRSDFFGPALGDAYLALQAGRWDYAGLLRQWRIDVVLAPAEWPLATLLKRDPEWRLVSDDGQALLFVRPQASPLPPPAPLPPRGSQKTFALMPQPPSAEGMSRDLG
jgi:hypothetical protein